MGEIGKGEKLVSMFHILIWVVVTSVYTSKSIEQYTETCVFYCMYHNEINKWKSDDIQKTKQKLCQSITPKRVYGSVHSPETTITPGTVRHMIPVWRQEHFSYLCWWQVTLTCLHVVSCLWRAPFHTSAHFHRVECFLTSLFGLFTNTDISPLSYKLQFFRVSLTS